MAPSTMLGKPRQLYIGTSGWSHRNWAGKFYPLDMSPAKYLKTYAYHFPVVEIESTFHELPSHQIVDTWYRRSPDDFCFVPCFPRSITHEQRLRNTQDTVYQFLETICRLGGKLGPLLIQLPENFRHNERSVLKTFFKTLPKTFRYAIEFRHGSWLKDSTYKLLEDHQIGWVIVDASFLPRRPRVTAPFSYIRWHGHPSLAQRTRNETDPATALSPWIPIVQNLQRQSTQVYGFVRNSFSGYAPRDCDTLLQLLGESQ